MLPAFIYLVLLLPVTQPRALFVLRSPQLSSSVYSLASAVFSSLLLFAPGAVSVPVSFFFLNLVAWKLFCLVFNPLSTALIMTKQKHSENHPHQYFKHLQTRAQKRQVRKQTGRKGRAAATGQKMKRQRPNRIWLWKAAAWFELLAQRQLGQNKLTEAKHSQWKQAHNESEQSRQGGIWGAPDLRVLRVDLPSAPGLVHERRLWSPLMLRFPAWQCFILTPDVFSSLLFGYMMQCSSVRVFLSPLLRLRDEHNSAAFSSFILFKPLFRGE